MYQCLGVVDGDGDSNDGGDDGKNDGDEDDSESDSSSSSSSSSSDPNIPLQTQGTREVTGRPVAIVPSPP